VLCNHNALIDVPVSFPEFPAVINNCKNRNGQDTRIRLYIKQEACLVDRKSEVSRRESFSKMKDVLDMGLHMCIYPEGTRKYTGQPLKSFS